jgi:tetrahydromethanopterin S-methyltransferase subunit B
MSWRSKDDQVVPEEAPAPTADDDVLAQRLAELTHREVALRRITEAVEKQRTLLEERERALESSTSAVAAAGEERLADAIRRAEQAEQRIRELEQRVVDLETRPEPQAPEQPIQMTPVAATVVAAAPRGAAVELEGTESTYTLQRLERLVHDAQLRGDPQAEEWAYYLPLLREHAEPDGRLPAQFASLVDSIFAD